MGIEISTAGSNSVLTCEETCLLEHVPPRSGAMSSAASPAPEPALLDRIDRWCWWRLKPRASRPRAWCHRSAGVLHSGRHLKGSTATACGLQRALDPLGDTRTNADYGSALVSPSMEELLESLAVRLEIVADKLDHLDSISDKLDELVHLDSISDKLDHLDSISDKLDTRSTRSSDKLDKSRRARPPRLDLRQARQARRARPPRLDLRQARQARRARPPRLDLRQAR